MKGDIMARKRKSTNVNTAPSHLCKNIIHCDMKELTLGKNPLVAVSAIRNLSQEMLKFFMRGLTQVKNPSNAGSAARASQTVQTRQSMKEPTLGKSHTSANTVLTLLQGRSTKSLMKEFTQERNHGNASFVERPLLALKTRTYMWNQFTSFLVSSHLNVLFAIKDFWEIGIGLSMRESTQGKSHSNACIARRLSKLQEKEIDMKNLTTFRKVNKISNCLSWITQFSRLMQSSRTTYRYSQYRYNSTALITNRDRSKESLYWLMMMQQLFCWPAFLKRKVKSNVLGIPFSWQFSICQDRMSFQFPCTYLWTYHKL